MLSPKQSFYSLISLLGGVICLWTVLIVSLKVLSTVLNFDETIHVHFLWLVSIGRVPHTGFWCFYPALGYIITLPFFRLLPESVYSVFALRFFALSLFLGLAAVLFFHARHLRAHWVWGIATLSLIVLSVNITPVTEFKPDSYAALSAILALSLMFEKPTFLRGAFAAGLSVLSVVIMPKYVHPLFLTNLAYLGYGCLKMKRLKQALLSVLAGTAAALLLAQLLLAAAGTALWEDFYWSSILQMRYFNHYARIRPVGAPSAIGVAGAYFSQFWWIGLILLLGVSGWFISEKTKWGIRFWTGGAIIAGVALLWGISAYPGMQYIVPGLFCLALFAPYTGALLKNKAVNAAGAFLLMALLTFMNIKYTRETAKELAWGQETDEGTMQSFKYFAARQEFLDLIPRGERVVGSYHSHPVFRENLTFMTLAMRFLPVISIDSPVWNLFQRSYFARSLESSPPASISLSASVPPGWDGVLSDFLRRHADKYEPISLNFDRIYIRKDLLK